MPTQGFMSLELRVQFCLLVCCTYPSLSTVNKEKNRTDQRASLRVDTRETQQRASLPLCLQGILQHCRYELTSGTDGENKMATFP